MEEQVRHKSRIKPNFEFDENQWVVSVINSKNNKSGLIFGHAVLLIEGVKINQAGVHFSKTLFIGQYDIQAVPYTLEEGSLARFKNVKGEITKINMRESNEYNHPRGNEFYSSPSRSWQVLRANVDLMLDSILKDHELVEKANRGEGERPKYQFFGRQGGPLAFLFGDKEAGVNCAEWCVQKLRIANVNLTYTESKAKAPGIL